MHLPPELTDIVIDHLYGDQHSLSACALTCREWLPTVRYHRFHHTSLPVSRDSTQRFHEVLLASPEICILVQSLELHGPVGSAEVHTWENASYTFLTLLPAVARLKLVAVILEDSVQGMLVTSLRGVTQLAMYRCRYRSFQSLVTLIGSFPSLHTLSLSFGIKWRFHFPLPASVASDLRSHLPAGLRTLRLGEPRSEDHARSSEIVTVREMLMLEIHTKRTVHVAQQLLNALSSDTLEALELDVGGTNGLLRSIEREGFTLAPCTRLRTCMLRVLLRYSPSHNNDPDVRGFVTLLATLASPLLKTLTLSLYIQDAEDSSTARRVRFDELQAFDWASIGAMLGPTRLPALQKLLVEGTGEMAVLEDYIRHVLPALYARRVVQLVPYTRR